MDIIGKIHSIDEPVQITERFTKQTFILDLSRFNQDTGELYENYAELQVNNNKVDLDMFSSGQKVKATFFVSGRFWEKKDGSGTAFFQNLICTDIELFGENQNTKPPKRNTAPQPTTAQPGGNYSDYSEEESDDLPF